MKKIFTWLNLFILLITCKTVLGIYTCDNTVSDQTTQCKQDGNTQQPYCINNICVECRNNQDCGKKSYNTAMCNANNVCDICQQDSDCTQMGVFTYCGTNWWGEDRTCEQCYNGDGAQQNSKCSGIIPRNNVCEITTEFYITNCVCGNNSECINPARPICDNTNTNACVECLNNSNCRDVNKPVCNHGLCGQCAQNSDCQSLTAPKCDNTNICSPCVTDADCLEKIGNNHCQSGRCGPGVASCESNANCLSITASKCSSNACSSCSVNEDCSHLVGTTYCQSGQCVQCLSNDNCSSLTSSKCSSNTCSSCSVNEDCSHLVGTSYCQSEQCVQCLSNDNCSSLSASKCDNTNVCSQCVIDDDCSHQTGKTHCNSGTCDTPQQVAQVAQVQDDCNPDTPIGIIYENCNYEGQSVKICGEHPNLNITWTPKSVVVPEGYYIILYNEPWYEGKTIRFSETIDCIESFEMSLFQKYGITILDKDQDHTVQHFSLIKINKTNKKLGANSKGKAMRRN